MFDPQSAHIAKKHRARTWECETSDAHSSPPSVQHGSTGVSTLSTLLFLMMRCGNKNGRRVFSIRFRPFSSLALGKTLSWWRSQVKNEIVRLFHGPKQGMSKGWVSSAMHKLPCGCINSLVDVAARSEMMSKKMNWRWVITLNGVYCYLWMAEGVKECRRKLQPHDD